MMISTKGRYALRFLVDVAEHQAESFVPLRDVAERQGISEKYLEIIVKELVKGGELEAMRGKGGGYRLNRPPEEYSVRSVLERMEGPLAPVACLGPGQKPCPRQADCRTLTLANGPPRARAKAFTAEYPATCGHTSVAGGMLVLR
ncbi:MAG: Rrf2 family transcriptional regulator [Oscillospiraceae bacterium]|nr:Rrf2 family transcriptional regulator [Oscillospiraceae bacterium]